MHDSGQYSINAEEASSLQLKLSIKRFTCRFENCEKMTEQATLNENVREMDSACRNQQGKCDEVENNARPFFLALQLNLCNNSDQTLFSNALTFARSLGPRLSTSPSGPDER